MLTLICHVAPPHLRRSPSLSIRSNDDVKNGMESLVLNLTLEYLRSAHSRGLRGLDEEEEDSTMKGEFFITRVGNDEGDNKGGGGEEEAVKPNLGDDEGGRRGGWRVRRGMVPKAGEFLSQREFCPAHTLSLSLSISLSLFTHPLLPTPTTPQSDLLEYPSSSSA